MTIATDPRLVRRFDIAAFAGAVFSIAIGFSGLLGWTLRIPALYTWNVGRVPVRPTAAVCFPLLGVAFLILKRNVVLLRRSPIRMAARAAVLMVMVVGALGLIENFLGLDLRIDELIYAIQPSETFGSARPGMLPPIACVDLLLLGGAVLALDWRLPHGTWPAQFFAGTALLVSSFAAFDFILGPKGSHTLVAFPGAVNFLVLSLSVISARAEWAVGGLLTSQGEGARLLRRVAPAALLVQSIIGLMISGTLLAERRLSWGQTSALAVVCIVVLVALITWSAFIVNRSDEQRLTALAALRESEGRLAGIVQSAMDAIISIDENQKIVVFNAAAEKMFLCPAADALGKSMDRFIPERLREGHASHVRNFATTGTTNRTIGIAHSLLGVRPNGEEFPIEASISQVGVGAAKLLTVIIRDVSARVHAEASQLRLAAIVESADSAILSKTLEGIVTSWNRGAEILYGYSEAEMLGSHVNRLIPAELQAEEVESLRQVATGKMVHRNETVRRRKDGSLIYVSVILSPVRDADGKIIGASTISHDITEAKRRENTLREQAELLDLAQVLVRDMDGKIVMWSRGAEKLYGISAEEAVGRISHELLQSQFPIPVREIEKRLLSQNQWEGELMHRRKDGSVVVVNSTWILHRDEQGKPLRILEVNADVTARKVAEQMLATSEERLRMFIEHSPAALAMFDRDMRYLYASHRWLTDYGIEGQDVHGQSHYEIFPEIPEYWKRLHHRGMEGEVLTADCDRFERADGSVQWVKWEIRPWRDGVGEIGGIVIFAEDITDSKHAEDALRESEQRFHAIANDIPQLAWMADSDGSVFWYNQRWYEYTGTTFQQVQGQGWQSVVDPLALPVVLETWRGAIATGQPASLEFPIRGADGIFRSFLTRTMPLKNAEGRVLRWIGTNTDISERKQAEEALRASENEARARASELEAFLNAVPAVTFIAHDRQCRRITSNRAAYEMLRLAPGSNTSRSVAPEGGVHTFRAMKDGRELAPEELPLQLAAHTGRAVRDYELTIVLEDGTSHDLFGHAMPLLDEAGQSRGAVGAFVDITERKRVEEALRENHARLKKVLEVETVGVLFWDLTTGALKDANDTFLNLMGYSRDDVATGELTWQRLTPPEFMEASRAELRKFAACGRVGPYEKEYFHKDGSRQWFVFAGSSLGGDSCVEFCVDITDRKRAEAALHESEERFQAMVNGIPQLAWMANPDGHIFWYNQRWYEYTGTTFEQIEGWGWQSVHDPSVLPKVLERWKESIASGKPFDMEFPLRGADGNFRMFLTLIHPFKNSHGEVVLWFGTNTDITERKQAEERLTAQAAELQNQANELKQSQQALQDQKRILQLVLNSVGDGVAACDEDGRVLFWSPSMAKILGYENPGWTHPETSGKQRVSGASYPEQPSGGWQIYLADGITLCPQEEHPMTQAMRGQECDIELFFSHPKRGSLWVAASARPIREGDSLRGAVLALREITQAKVAERELAARAEELSRQADELLRSQAALETQKLLLQSVLNSMEEGLVAADETGKFLLWNPAATKIVGMNAGDVPPSEWSQHYGVYQEDTATPFPGEQNPLLRAIRGETSTAVMFLRNPAISEGVWIEINGNPLRDQSGARQGGLVAFRNITQRRMDEQKIRKLNEELEERVLQRTAELQAANRELEAFTYSVSHDLRAPLRHIGGFSRILMEDFGPGLMPEARDHIQRIEDGVQRMGLLVDELLNLARVGRHALKLQRTDLNVIVEEVLSLLQPESTGRAVTWKIDSLPAAHCDPILIKQVFQNFIANALKFTRPRQRADIEISCRRENGSLVIAVRDNGVGFNMKYADKLFGVFQRLHRGEDFEGTGIGLATVQRIVHKHGGRVWAESEPEKGATFYFTLSPADAVLPALSMEAGQTLSRGHLDRAATAGAQL